MSLNDPSRRGFIRTAAVATAAAAMVRPSRLLADDAAPAKPRLKKAIMFSLLGIGGTLLHRFEEAKAAGFDGVEVDAPSHMDHAELLAAKEKTGITIHGVCDSVHWKDRLSDPDAAVRARGLEGLEQAIRDCAEFGGNTVLLVPGRVGDKEKENYEQVWQRSQEGIRKAIPLAKEKNVVIAVEVVWNNFWTKPEQMAQYLDEINDPNVRGYLDLGNVVKFGVPASQWVRVLGKRIAKLHVKGYSHQKQWVNIGDGDEDWPEINKALAEVGYSGWATAEVWARSIDELHDVSRRLDRVLGM